MWATKEKNKLVLMLLALALNSCGVIIMKGISTKVSEADSSTSSTDSVSGLVANSLTTYTAFEDNQSAMITLSYTDPDGGLATACAISNTSNLTVTRACSCSAGVCTLKITPASGFTGTATFSYTVTVAGQVSAAAVASVPVVTSLTTWIGSAANPSPFLSGQTIVAGIGDGSFSQPLAIAVDEINGFTFVLDIQGQRVNKFLTSTGVFIGAIGKVSSSTGTCIAGAAATGWCNGGTFISGSGDGMFSYPRGLAIDVTHGYLYVSDDNYRVQKFNLSTGAFIGAIGQTTSSTGTCPAAAVVSSWCTGGVFTNVSADGSFPYPGALAIDPVNNFLFVSTMGTRIQKLNLSTGVFVGAIGKVSASTGTCVAVAAATGWCTGGTFASALTDGTFNSITSIAADPAGDFLYVADSGSRRISKFVLSTGAFVGALGKVSASSGTCPGSGSTNGWCTGGTFTFGLGDGMFTEPHGVTLDTTNGFLYTADFYQQKVQKFNLTTGVFIGAIGMTTASSGTCPASGVASGWCTGGTFQSGGADGAFGYPRGIAADIVHNFLYVTNANDARVHKFTLSTGAYIGTAGGAVNNISTWTASSATPSTGLYTDNTLFGNPEAVAVDAAAGFFYVADKWHHRIAKFNLATGAFVGAIGRVDSSTGTCVAGGFSAGWCTGGSFSVSYGSDGFSEPEEVAVDTVNDFLYVYSNESIQKFDLSTGALIGGIGNVGTTSGTCVAGAAAPGWCTGGTFYSGSGDGMFSSYSIASIAVDPANDLLYVAQKFRVQKFTLSTGAFIGAIGGTSASSGTCAASGATNAWCTGGTFVGGSADGTFGSAKGLVIDEANDFLYVGDYNAGKISKIDLTTGAFIGAIGKTSASSGTCPSSGASNAWCTGGTPAYGTGDGMFTSIKGMTADLSGQFLYVADNANGRIQKINLTTGAFIGATGFVKTSSGTCTAAKVAVGWCTGGAMQSGAGNGMYNGPHGLAWDNLSNALLIIDNGNNRVVRLDLN